VLNELSLFTGIGGGLLGTHLLGFRPVCAVEKEPYCREVLLQRQRDGMLPMFPIWDNAETFDGKPWRGAVDLVSAGFPCQPFSVAGKRKGADDERNLWPETIRIIREVQPQFAFLENVPGLIRSGYFGQILEDLMGAGYDAEWCVLGADDVGAPHRRKRLWILAHANQFNDDRRRHGTSAIQRERSSQTDIRNSQSEILANSKVNAIRAGFRQGEQGRQRGRRPGDSGDEVANAKSKRQKLRSTEGKRQGRFASGRIKWWDEDPADISNTNSNGLSEAGKSGASIGGNGIVGNNGRSIKSRVGRLAHGVPFRVDRLKTLGNAQVPAVVCRAWETLIQYIDTE